MIDYKKGKIYKITSKETEDIYIGSTCSTLKDRLCKHKSQYKRMLGGAKFRKSTSDKILKYSDAIIELIELFPCETKRELLDREGHFIKNTPNCVNTQIQGRTMKQYREDNKDKLKRQGVEYREKNKDILKQKYNDWDKSDKGKAYHEKQKVKRNVKVKCSKCGKEVSKSNLNRHQKSKNCTE